MPITPRVEHRNITKIRMNVVGFMVVAGKIGACAVSFALHKSVGWAILHGILGWLYVSYLGIKLYLDANPDLLNALRD